jgi:NitT/TauT family transport system substrate-binding protein
MAWRAGRAGLLELTSRQMLGSRIRMQAERSVATPWRSSTVQVWPGTVLASRLRRHETSIAGVATDAGPEVIRMRLDPTIALRCVLASLIGLWGLAGFGSAASRAADEARPPIAIQFSLDRPIDASAAPFVLASVRGLFSSEGLAVTTNIASGSLDAIARVAAGDSDFALVDINELIRFRDKPSTQPIKAVFVLFNKAPYAIIARKSRGIHALPDLEGKTLGVAQGDPSIRLWPAVARQNGINIASVKQSKISAAVREPMLSAGQVDAVTGFSYLSAVNLRDRGVPADDLAVLRFADYGCEAYGFAVIVNPALAAAKPEAVKGFLRAVIGGTHLAIKEPRRAADEVVNRMDGGSRELELERLRILIRDNLVTGEVQRNGVGAIDPARLERSIDQIAEDFKFQKRPSAADIFDDAFLPPLGGRLIN